MHSIIPALSRQSDSPEVEVEDVCLNLTVSSRLSPDREDYDDDDEIGSGIVMLSESGSIEMGEEEKRLEAKEDTED